MFIAHRGPFPSTTARESHSLCIRSPQLCLKYFTEDPQPPPTNLTDVRKKKLRGFQLLRRIDPKPWGRMNENTCAELFFYIMFQSGFFLLVS